MNTTENQNDPYAELNAAWEAGRRITCKHWPKGEYVQKGKTGFVVWFYPLSDYEIEPIPADKWAAEKAAHAQGKKIQKQDRILGGQWHDDSNPNWHTGWNWRIAPDPALAGKLTDEQLGEFGAKEASNWIKERAHTFSMVINDRSAWWDQDAPARTAFARAVREAVEAKQAEEITSLLQDKADAIAMAQAAERETSREQDMRSKDREEIASLQKSYEVERHCSGERMQKILNLQREVEKANAELERLRWRSVEVKPTAKDAGLNGFLEVMKNGVTSLAHWNSTTMADPADYKVTHWRPFCPPPAPTAEEVERINFEHAYRTAYPDSVADIFDRDSTGEYIHTVVRVSWDLWQARAAKEVEK